MKQIKSQNSTLDMLINMINLVYFRHQVLVTDVDQTELPEKCWGSRTWVRTTQTSVIQQLAAIQTQGLVGIYLWPPQDRTKISLCVLMFYLMFFCVLLNLFRLDGIVLDAWWTAKCYLKEKQKISLVKIDQIHKAGSLFVVFRGVFSVST